MNPTNYGCNGCGQSCAGKLGFCTWCGAELDRDELLLERLLVRSRPNALRNGLQRPLEPRTSGAVEQKAAGLAPIPPAPPPAAPEGHSPAGGGVPDRRLPRAIWALVFVITVVAVSLILLPSLGLIEMRGFWPNMAPSDQPQTVTPSQAVVETTVVAPPTDEAVTSEPEISATQQAVQVHSPSPSPSLTLSPSPTWGRPAPTAQPVIRLIADGHELRDSAGGRDIVVLRAELQTIGFPQETEIVLQTQAPSGWQAINGETATDADIINQKISVLAGDSTIPIAQQLQSSLPYSGTRPRYWVTMTVAAGTSIPVSLLSPLSVSWEIELQGAPLMEISELSISAGPAITETVAANDPVDLSFIILNKGKVRLQDLSFAIQLPPAFDLASCAQSGAQTGGDLIPRAPVESAAASVRQFDLAFVDDPSYGQQTAAIQCLLNVTQNAPIGPLGPESRVVLTATAQTADKVEVSDSGVSEPAFRVVVRGQVSNLRQGQSLSVRPGPGVNFEPEIGELPNGQAVEIIGANSGRTWYRILPVEGLPRTGNPDLWVNSDYVVLEIPDLKQTIPEEGGG